jgi:hypothetical protein
LLAAILLLRFRKVPFTCSYPPFRDSAIPVVIAYVFGFFLFVGVADRLEYWALQYPRSLILLVPLALAAWYALHRFQQGSIEVDKRLIFEEKQPVDFEVLDLAHWS